MLLLFHNKLRHCFFCLMLVGIVLSNLTSCHGLDDIYDSSDRVKIEVTDVDSAVKALKEAYNQAKIINSVLPLVDGNQGWVVSFTDKTEITFAEGIIADVNKDEGSGVIQIKLSDGSSFWFNTHYVNPTGIVVLGTKSIKLSCGKRDTIEFRLNPSNASVKMYGDDCHIELDKVANVMSQSPYDAASYYKLIGVEQVYDESTNDVKIGHYRAIIEDAKASAEYDEMGALVLSTEDVNGESIQISSSPFEVKGHNYDNLPNTGLPVVIINTPNSKPILSKEEYIVGSDITVLNADMTYDFQGEMKIKGRGNATWHSYPKKPYAIKLENKKSLLGFPQSKKWTLLAEFCDKSMLRTAFMLEMSKACSLKYTVNYKHVEVILNGQYNGTYILTEKVEKDKNRIDIKSDGFIIEYDGYANLEPLWFTTTRDRRMYSFKYPDPDGGIAEGDDNFNYISNFMNELEKSLYSYKYKDPEIGYRHYIDSRSFARWYILMELLGNVDPNRFYVMEERGAKLEMYPAWDAEWSLGLANIGNGGVWIKNEGVPMPYDKAFHKGVDYFVRLLQDPNFKADVKYEWNIIKSKIPEALSKLQSLRNSLCKAQEKNFTRWPILGTYQSVETVTFDTWEEEADFVFDYFNLRYSWFDSYVEKM